MEKNLFDKQKTIRLKLQKGEALTPAEADYAKPFVEKAQSHQIDELRQTGKQLAAAKTAVESGKLDTLRLDINTPKDRWPDNFMVSTGTGQRQYGWGSLFIRDVLGHLSKDHPSFPDAIRHVEQHRAMIHDVEKAGKPDGKAYQAPVSSTRQFDCWRLPDGKTTPPPRKIIYIQGENKDSDEEFNGNRTYDDFHATMKEKYGPTVEITRLKQPSIQEIEAAFAKAKAESTPDTEVMIVLKGHGGASGREEGVSKAEAYKEGSQQGYFWLRGQDDDTVYLNESKLKALTRTLNCKSGLILADCCHAGAWIAQVPPQPAKPLQRPDFLSLSVG